MKLKFALVAVLFPFVVHAQSTCPQGGTLPRYEEARDQHLPAQDGLLGPGARHMVEVTVEEISTGLRDGLLDAGNLGGVGQVMPILENAGNLADMQSPDENVKVDGALNMLNTTVWSHIRPLHLDQLARNMLYGLRGDPGSSAGESLDAVNRRQVFRAGCKGQVWGLAHYDPRNQGELYEPKIQCQALGVNFDPMLSPAVERGGITETISDSLETGVVTKAVMCAESGFSPSLDPNSTTPEFSLFASANVVYYLTKVDAFSEFGMLHYEAQTSGAATYESRQAVSPVNEAYGGAWVGTNGRIGALGLYRSNNVVLQLLYYSPVELVSSVPSVSTEQQLAQQIMSGVSSP